MKKILTAPSIQIVLLTALVLACMVSPLGSWAYFENRNFDFWVERFRHAQEQPIAIVAIDERSIRQFGDWPWPRSRIADLVGLISDHGAGAWASASFTPNRAKAPGCLNSGSLKPNSATRNGNGPGHPSTVWMACSARPKHD